MPSKKPEDKEERKSFFGKIARTAKNKFYLPKLQIQILCKKRFRAGVKMPFLHKDKTDGCEEIQG